ncbi:hypothetical protein GCM10027060_10130 [Nesterenkonia halophila]|uniref:N-acetylmuramoyl-L-alanine amidase n=1 Tax=Nesterenkonia halophila TaxID=302044 RepID=UPI0012917FC5|nr:peptidoglycan recognition family protein [Nesterenkonia halophila]
MSPTWVTSPNYTEGRGGTPIDRIVIHYIVGRLSAADATFQNPDSGVSAHYGIGEGRVHQYVSVFNTAWHAGDWGFNQRSIGIEHSADQYRAPTWETIMASVDRCTILCRQFGLDPMTAIVPHDSIRATACPGTVDWEDIRDRTAQQV